MPEGLTYINEVKGKTAEEVLALADCASAGPKGDYLRIAAQVRTNQELAGELRTASRDSGKLQLRLIILTVVIAVAGMAQAVATAWPNLASWVNRGFRFSN
jgi:hypothetical protein